MKLGYYLPIYSQHMLHILFWLWKGAKIRCRSAPTRCLLLIGFVLTLLRLIFLWFKLATELLQLLPTSRAFCCADIPCYFCPVLLLIKDRKLMLYSKARLCS